MSSNVVPFKPREAKPLPIQEDDVVGVTPTHAMRLWVWGGCKDDSLRDELFDLLEDRDDGHVACSRDLYDRWDEEFNRGNGGEQGV